MVYINSDGTIGEKPWHKSIVEIFWGFIHFIVIFFQTLVNPGWNSGNRSINNRRSDGGGGGGGGSGGKPAWRPKPFGGQCRTLSSLQASMPSGG